MGCFDCVGSIGRVLGFKQLTVYEWTRRVFSGTPAVTMAHNTTIVDLPNTKLPYRFLQPLWDLHLGYEDYVESPLFPIVISVGFYFMCMVPFTILDLFCKDWKFIQQYKIQPDKDVTWPSVRKAILLTLWNHLIFILPVSMAQWVWTPPTAVPKLAPTVWELCSECFGALAIFDLEYFIWHSIHHKIRILYKYVHSIHHQYHSPSSWVTQYLHPWELVSVGIFTTTSPWFFKSHPLTQWAFQQFSIVVSVEAHIGYDFPGFPHRWNPFWGGSIKHDMHHQKPLTNFAPFFNYCDMLLGSYCPGQGAGGHKPQSLLTWEADTAKEKAEVKRQREAREANGKVTNGAVSNGISNGHIKQN